MIYIASGFTGNAYPLSHPRIGWDRITGTATASGSAAGFAAANANTTRTDSFWRPTGSPAWWRIDAGAPVNVNYLGIAAHDIGTQDATVAIQRSTDGTTWTGLGLTVEPVDDSPIFVLFGTLSFRYWRIVVTYSGTAPTIGTIAFGEVMEFPRPAVYAPSVSFERAKRTSFDVNISDGGQWLGRTKVRQSLAPTMQVNNLSETWIASTFDEFATYAEDQPFFIADRPGDYPASCSYAWSLTDIIPERQTAKASISHSVTMELQGFRD